MRKYFQLAKVTFQEYLVYRLNFILWRFRSLMEFLALYFFWWAIFSTKSEFLGYQKAQMFAYLVGIAVLRSLVMGSRSSDFAGKIRSGELTKELLKPVNIFSYWASRDFVDKLLNLFFIVFELGLVVKLFSLPFYWPKEPITILLFLLVLALAILIYFFFSLTISIASFWTEEIWATRWLFGVVLMEFFSGAFFPIDVLPASLVRVINLTPFPYLLYFPIKIWLEQLSSVTISQVILICFVWLGFFYKLAHFLWQKGVKNYGAYGG
jgi:ABC-2 type transport system permease protein